MRNIRGGCNIKAYSYYCFILFIFEIDPGGVGLPPLLWYFLYITCSDIALILSIYTYLKCFDLTFSEEKYPIKAKLLGFAVANLCRERELEHVMKTVYIEELTTCPEKHQVYHVTKSFYLPSRFMLNNFEETE